MYDGGSSIPDNTPEGNQTEQSTVVTTKSSTHRTVKVMVPFDENLKEFQLWDFLYDRDKKFDLESETDWDKRIEVYSLTGEPTDIKKLIRWLKKNEFSYFLTKK
jgi:non-ribosomal peptide synthetase component E (peptide arylation enzyme)